MFLSEQERSKRIAYNQELSLPTRELLNTIPKVIIDGELYGDFVIVKLQYYIDFTTTESGLIEPSFKIGETADGRPKASFKDNEFSPVGRIVKVGDEGNSKKYTTGDKVWIDFRMLNSNGYDFLIDLENPVAKPQGYVRIPSQLITFVEKKG